MANVEAIGTGFLDPADYPHCALLEASYPKIVAELRQVTRTPAWFIYRERPYTPSAIVLGTIGDTSEPHWRLFGLYLRHRPVERHCRLCPETARALGAIPNLRKAAFACLEAGASIGAHLGQSPHIARTHLGLVIPEGDCGITMGGHMRRWEPGKTMIFRDNQVHEAWNRTPEHRHVLIVDVPLRVEDGGSPDPAPDDDAF